jgi:hypothetical protein
MLDRETQRSERDRCDHAGPRRVCERADDGHDARRAQREGRLARDEADRAQHSDEVGAPPPGDEHGAARHHDGSRDEAPRRRAAGAERCGHGEHERDARDRRPEHGRLGVPNPEQHDEVEPDESGAGSGERPHELPCGGEGQSGTAPPGLPGDDCADDDRGDAVAGCLHGEHRKRRGGGEHAHAAAGEDHGENAPQGGRRGSHGSTVARWWTTGQVHGQPISLVQ